MKDSERHLDRAAFTLAELLVAMAVIAIISTITVIAVARISNDARLSSARNTVTAVLDNARALAVKNHEIVMVAFRAAPAGEEEVVEAVFARWTGGSVFHGNGFLVDRYEPIFEAATRRMPRGIKLAAPLYVGGLDDKWTTTSDLSAVEQTNEMPGAVIAVMFGPDGTSITRNGRSDADLAFIDFNSDRRQSQDNVDYDYDPAALEFRDYPIIGPSYGSLGTDVNGDPIAVYSVQRRETDEPFVVIAPFLAVYDDHEARELSEPATWIDGDVRVNQLSRYINDRADRIHFNRYTGVTMR